MSRPPERAQPPILLTKAEAMEFAAACLERQAVDIKLSAIIVKEIKPGDLPSGWVSEEFERLQKSLPDPGLQQAAMREAAAAIRAVALEERLVEARVRAQRPAEARR